MQLVMSMSSRVFQVRWYYYNHGFVFNSISKEMNASLRHGNVITQWIAMTSLMKMRQFAMKKSPGNALGSNFSAKTLGNASHNTGYVTR